jgi:hypothetical protein
VHRLRNKLTYANVIATIALFAALGGGAYAAGTINGKSIVDHSITGKDIKARSIPLTALKKIPQGAAGPAGPAGVAGPVGPAGPAGAPGTARAYGETADGAGNLIAARSKNATVRHPEKGVYCITPGTGIDPASASLLATADFANAGTSKTIAQIRSTNIDCKSGELEVRLWNDGATIDAQFSFLIP